MNPLLRNCITSHLVRRVLVGAVGLALGAGCGLPPIPACPDGGASETYQGFGRTFLARNCNTCHAYDAPDRHGAPAAFTFDTESEAMAHRDRIYYRATGDSPTMPPGPGKPPAADRARLADWLQCAAP